jgi:cytidine deaminase
VEPDWTALRAAAVGAMRRAYAPYSNFPVGAAALVDDGRVIVGCNVENASYGVGLCAECGLISALHTSGGGRLVAIACVDGHGTPLMPCGRCRQLLWEHGGAKLLVDHVDGPVPMDVLLPHAFDEVDLGRVGSGPANRAAAHLVGAERVPARLAGQVGRGTVFVHPDVAGGQQVWTGYWGADEPGGGPGAGRPAGAIIEEGPIWPDATAGVAWGRARTSRVVVVDGQGGTYWAGGGARPAELTEEWHA